MEKLYLLSTEHVFMAKNHYALYTTRSAGETSVSSWNYKIILKRLNILAAKKNKLLQ